MARGRNAAVDASHTAPRLRCYPFAVAWARSTRGSTVAGCSEGNASVGARSRCSGSRLPVPRRHCTPPLFRSSSTTSPPIASSASAGRPSVNCRCRARRTSPACPSGCKRRASRRAPLVLLRVFKASSEIELWMRKDDAFVLFATYPICHWSGTLGPKLREGDRQTPEGYTITSRQLHLAGRWPRSLNLGFPTSSTGRRRATDPSFWCTAAAPRPAASP